MHATYPTGNTALLLVDVLNDFLAKDGKVTAAIGPMVEKLELKANLQRLLDGVRQAGVKTFYVPHGLDDHSFDDVPHLLPTFQTAMTNKVFWKGEYGSQFYAPLRPREGDIVISQHRMFDGFIGTDLLEQLQAHGIEHVVLAGLTSHTCVEGTGRHALEAGFHVTFLTDAVAEFTDAAHRAAIDISYPTFGHVVTTIDAFLAAIEPQAA